MSGTPNHDDANLILRLYDLRREDRMRQAREWFAGQFHFRSIEEFQKGCPPGSSMNASFRMVTSYWEMAASFVTSGVLDEQLFLQSGMELLFVWERVRDLVPSLREASKNPGAYKSIEKVAAAAVEYLKAQGPEAYDAFSARVRGNR